VVRDRIVDLLHEIAEIPRDRIVDGATIDGDLTMESIDFMELQVTLEEEFGIEIDPIRVVELNELAAIVDYVHGRTAPTGS
jgi:acyl carrier protein